MASTTLRIRSIDGLRTIAVLAVLLFHIDHALLPGGYLGVDLFFLISGFVVTKGLLDRRPSYRQFITRRFYRLFPAAAATVLCTLLAFQFTGSGLLTHEYIASAIASLTAWSNVYYMLHSSYFDTVLQGNPFLHFWSLSVEEQYYLVWPWAILLVIGWRLSSIALLVAVLAVISAAFFIWSPDLAFYLTPARAFQFGAGAFVYFFAAKRGIKAPNFAPYTALVATILLFLTHDGSQNWIVGVLIPTVVFAALIASVATRESEGLLTARPVQIVGLASYSIYLVHWPIVVYLNIVTGMTAADKLLAGVLSIMLGLLLHHAIEKPFNWRGGKAGIGTRYGAPIIVATAFSIWVALYSTYSAQLGSSGPMAAEGASQPGDLLVESSEFRKVTSRKLWGCNTYETGRRQGDAKYKLLADLDLKECLSGSTLLISDSTGEAAAYLIPTLINSSNLAILSAAGCPLDPKITAEDCSRMNELRFDLLSQQKCGYAKVFLAFNWGVYTRERVERVFNAVRQSSCNIVVTSTLPYFKVNPNQVIAADGPAVDLHSRMDATLLAHRAEFNTIIGAIPNVEVLNWSALDYDKSVPAVTPQGNPIYRDNYHFTPEGKNWLVLEYLRRHSGSASGAS